MTELAIPPQANHPIRQYPLRPVNEPPMFVSLERFGQKVWPQGHPQSLPPNMQGPGPGPQMPQQIGLPMNMSQQQAMVAQQNSNMEALERRRAQERERERLARAAVRLLQQPIQPSDTSYSVLPNRAMMMRSPKVRFVLSDQPWCLRWL